MSPGDKDSFMPRACLAVGTAAPPSLAFDGPRPGLPDNAFPVCSQDPPMCHRRPWVTGWRPGQHPSTAALGGGLAPGVAGPRARTRRAPGGELGAPRGSRTRRLPRQRPAPGQDLGKATAHQLVRREAHPRHGPPGQVTCALLGAPGRASQPEGGPVFLGPE